MENKTATPLGKAFSTTENVVSQCDDQIFGSIVETLVINFDQEEFDQLLSGGSASRLNVRKHWRIFLARPPLVRLGRKSLLRQVRFSVNLLQLHARLNRLCLSLTQSQQRLT